ncbi:unnamed protein product [Sphagnum compactum]
MAEEGKRRRSAEDRSPIASIKFNGLERGKAAVAWMHNRVQETLQGVQHSVMKFHQGLPHPGMFVDGNAKVAPLKPEDIPGQILPPSQRSLEKDLEAWRRNSSWVDESPTIQVTVPQGAFCQVNSVFKIGIPPDAVYNILIDPGNKRVFKNIQEVRSRRVIEDDGHHQLVEVDQAAIWRFLCFSGTLSVCVMVDQDRRTRTVKFQLAKPGFMKQFEGSWKVQPLYVDSDGGPAPEDNANRVASIVSLQQVVQPAIVPPPPFKGYVRGITAKTTEDLMHELQAEGRRLREAMPEDLDMNDHQEDAYVRKAAFTTAFTDELRDSAQKLALNKRKSRKSRWRLKNDKS